jgi:hypothetical protein
VENSNAGKKQIPYEHSAETGFQSDCFGHGIIFNIQFGLSGLAMTNTPATQANIKAPESPSLRGMPGMKAESK